MIDSLLAILLGTIGTLGGVIAYMWRHQLTMAKTERTLFENQIGKLYASVEILERKLAASEKEITRLWQQLVTARKDLKDEKAKAD